MTDRLSEFLAVERRIAQHNYIQLAEYYSLPPETLSPDGVAITGIDGWHFIGNGGNHWEGQFLGELTLQPAVLQEWRDIFSRRLAASAAIGARFAHLVIPEKQAIFPQARWPAGIPTNGERPIQQILQAVPEGLIYPLQRLHDESWRAELTFRGNSHWCVSGSWFGFCELMRIVFPERSFDFALVPLERTWWRHDLLIKYISKPVYESVISIARRASLVYDNQLFAKTGRHVGNHYVLQNPAAPYQEVVVVFGDSYSFDIGFADLLAAFFGQVHFVWGGQIDFRYCEQMKARLVLAQAAERYMIRAPQSDLLPEKLNHF